MVIDFNRPNGSPSTNSAGRSSAAQANEQASTIKNSPQTNQAAVQPPAEGKDNVQLSSVAQQLQNISDKLKDTPSVDKERVARLKQAVAEGSYSPDSARIAEKILKFEAQS